MADKDQNDKPLKGEILPPENTAPLIVQETVQTEETVMLGILVAVALGILSEISAKIVKPAKDSGK